MKKTVLWVLVLIFLSVTGFCDTGESIVAQKESAKYHRSTCDYVQLMDKSTLRNFASVDEAKKAGHRHACAWCKP